MADAWNADVYSQGTVRNLPTMFATGKVVEKAYALSGASGEVFRKTWHMPPQKFIDNQCSPTNRYSGALAQELSSSIQSVIEFVYRNVRDKYRIEDPNSVDIPQYLYHETRTRTHCGKACLGGYFKNSLMIVPAYDPEMQTLQLKTPECPDYNLLMTLLFTRYAPSLLKIRFDKFHEAPDFENMIPYAQRINERFPICHKKVDNLTGGGKHFTYSRVTLKPRKFFHLAKTIPKYPAACRKLA